MKVEVDIGQGRVLIEMFVESFAPEYSWMPLLNNHEPPRSMGLGRTRLTAQPGPAGFPSRVKIPNSASRLATAKAAPVWYSARGSDVQRQGCWSGRDMAETTETAPNSPPPGGTEQQAIHQAPADAGQGDAPEHLQTRSPPA